VLERLARFVIHHRKLVVGGWLVLTILGAYSANAINKRWLDQFSIPGYSAYEANQRTLKLFGNGAQPPHVALFTVDGDVTKNTGIPAALAKFHQEPLGKGYRIGSYYSTQSRAYVSKDGHSTFATLYPPGKPGFSSDSHPGDVRNAIKAALPAGVQFHLTGRDALFDSQGSSEGPSVFTEALIGGGGALIILLFVFGTLPAVLMPILIAIAAILNTYTLTWLLTYITPVSRIVQFLIALVGLGVAIDYALLMIFRFREELRHGEDVETATIETMKHAGRSVIVSGSTVAIGLLSMVIIPIPVIRSIGIGGLLIPAVSVLVTITLMPAMFSLLGHRINKVRVMPRAIVEGTDLEQGFWWRWANLVLRRPLIVGAIGLAIVGLLLYSGSKIHAGEAQLNAERGAKTHDSVIGYNQLVADGFSPGVAKPLIVLIEGRPSTRVVDTIVGRLEQTKGIAGVGASPAWRNDDKAGLVEAFPDVDAAANAAGHTASDLKHRVLPALENELPGKVRLTLGGAAPEDRDFSRAVYSKFPYALLFVILLTFVLLMRAFRSVFLPLKAVVLNLVSLIAAYGIIVFVFQEGHGAQAIWNIQATGAIISWIPLMIFAFLYGLSMDYEVFMLTRMREEYDEHQDTNHAVALGLARTGKLVTSAALVLMFAFFVLSTSPGPDIKQFGIGLAAGIIFDATVIRALLVPSIMRVAGRWNWWFPEWVGRALYVRGPRAAEAAAESK
jgi:putative drug exporter of the RND superfamily